VGEVTLFFRLLGNQAPMMESGEGSVPTEKGGRRVSSFAEIVLYEKE